MPPTPSVTLKSEGECLVYGRDEQALEAAQAADVPALGHGHPDAPRGGDPAAPGRAADLPGHGHERRRPSRRVRADGRRLRADDGLVAREARLRAAARRRRDALRPDPRPRRRGAPVPGARQARRLLQARRRQPRGGAARAVRPHRSGRRVREAALRAVRGRALRPFALRAAPAARAASRSARRRRSSRPATWSRSIPYLCGGCGACHSVCPTGAAGYAYPPAPALLRAPAHAPDHLPQRRGRAPCRCWCTTTRMAAS